MRPGAPRIEHQRLWFATWGTQQAWATTAWWAEMRVRRKAFDRRLTRAAVNRLPVVVHGDVHIRPATAPDVELFADVGGRLPRGAQEWTP